MALCASYLSTPTPTSLCNRGVWRGIGDRFTEPAGARRQHDRMAGADEGPSLAEPSQGKTIKAFIPEIVSILVVLLASGDQCRTE